MRRAIIYIDENYAEFGEVSESHDNIRILYEGKLVWGKSYKQLENYLGFDYILKNNSIDVENVNLTQSKIEIVDRQKYITFKCSDYYIYNQKTIENYIIYKVSEWTDEKLTGDNVQTATFYNYMVNGIEVLDDYYIEKEFLVKYGMKSGYPTISLENLKSGHELVKKTYYRTL